MKGTKKCSKAMLREVQCRCAYCGKSLVNSVTVDHIIPKARGGADWQENLFAVCHECNCGKADKSLSEFRQILGVSMFWFEELGVKKESFYYEGGLAVPFDFEERFNIAKEKPMFTW